MVNPQWHVDRPLERHIARDQFKEQTAKRVDVRCRCDGLSETLLGRHVRGRANGPVDLRQPWQGRCAAQDRDTEIEYLDETAVDEHRVSGLDVAVHDVDSMHVRQHRGDLGRDRCRPRQAWWRGGVVGGAEDCLKSGTTQQLHDQPELSAAIGRGLDAGVVDRWGAGMFQPSRCEYLTDKTLAVSLKCVEDLGRLWTVRLGVD